MGSPSASVWLLRLLIIPPGETGKLSRKPSLLPVSSHCLDFLKEKKKITVSRSLRLNSLAKTQRQRTACRRLIRGVFSGDELVKGKKGRAGGRKWVAVKVVATAASADPTGSARAGMAPGSCPKVRTRARPLGPCIRAHCGPLATAKGYSQLEIHLLEELLCWP